MWGRKSIDKRVTVWWKEYALHRVIDKTATNVHHLLQRAERSRFNVDADENKVRMLQREHQALHQYFTNERDPQAQLRKHFNLTRWVIKEDIAEQLEELLNLPIEDFYKSNLVKWKRKWKR